VLFGGNEDQRPNQAYLLTDTTGTYGIVYFATPWKDNPLTLMTGINEAGLCFDINSIPEEPLNLDTGLIKVNDWALPNLMRQCSTVEEVLATVLD